MKQYKVIVQPEAQEEVDAIRIYQNNLDPKRGKRFIDAFQACLEQLKANPSFMRCATARIAGATPARRWSVGRCMRRTRSR